MVIVKEELRGFILRAGTIDTTSPQRKQGFFSQNLWLALRASNLKFDRVEYNPAGP